MHCRGYERPLAFPLDPLGHVQVKLPGVLTHTYTIAREFVFALALIHV
jgi:hypothetical protein